MGWLQMGVALITKKIKLKTILNPGSFFLLTQIRSFSAWHDREMRAVQNRQLNHANLQASSSRFVFYSNKGV